MQRVRRWWIAGAAAVALLAAAGTAVMAQTPVPGVTGSGSTFLERVAQKLGIDADAARDAVNAPPTT